MKTLTVYIPAVAESSYDIHIGNGTVATLWQELETTYPSLKKFIVTDSNVAAAGHLKNLIGDKDVPTFVIDPPGEQSKTIDIVIAIIEQMEQAMFGRDSLIVALGGGTVGDIAGFAAAIFKRGANVVQIPTTTVAQADSSVGGKTGVDSTISKNAFGAFFQPAAVYIDVETLKTLDDRQYRAGLIESVKHGLIADDEYFKFFEDNLDAILARDTEVLANIAYTNCLIKAAVVAQDPTEQNLRRVLNYGHTIGHAVESASGFDLLHGEAVAIGIVAAGLLEQKLGLSSKEQLQRIKNMLAKLSMPLEIPANLEKSVLIDLLKRDKKAQKQWPKFVLLDKIGNVHSKDGQWAHDVSRQLVEDALEMLY